MSVVAPAPIHLLARSDAGKLDRRPLARASSSRQTGLPAGFDVVAAYYKAAEGDSHPQPIAAILALVALMEASTASTVTGLASELTAGRQTLLDSQASLGVRAGCQLWERFFASAGGGEDDFPTLKKSLISQGKGFCTVTAPQCRQKIAALAVDFLVDDCTVLTHGYSRTVIASLLRAQAQHKRIDVYVTEGRPGSMGMRTYNALTKAGIPCSVVLDSAVAYVMERVDMVLVGTEAVVESGGLVSFVGTYQIALVAKAMSKPFYALAESYKFLRHYPLSQTDLPMPSGSEKPQLPLSFITPPQAPHSSSPTSATSAPTFQTGDLRMTTEMEQSNPAVDVTPPDLIDFIFTDLGAPLSPTAVSQYLVAQFSS